MKRGGRFFVAAAMLFVLAGPAFASAKRPVRRRSRTDWKSLLTTLYDAWGSRRAESASALYARDQDLVFFGLATQSSGGWSAYADGVQKRFLDEALSLAFRPDDDLKATERGSVAWTTLTVHVSAVMKDGSRLELDCRHTAIWELRGGKWLIVHEHLSSPRAG